MIELGAPEWLIFLPILAVLGWWLPRWRLYEPLRALLIFLIVLVACEPRWKWFSDGLDLWVLVDRSLSAEDGMSKSLPEWESILRSSRGANDRLIYVDFGREPKVRVEGSPEFDGSKTATEIPTAVDFALSRKNPHRATRLLLLTDGYSTQPLQGLSERLAREHVAMDARILPGNVQGDYQVDSFVAPPRVQPGEGFLLEIGVSGTPDATVPVELFRDGSRIGKTTVDIVDGRGVLRFSDRIPEPSARRYEVVVTAANDPRPGNNRAEVCVEAAGGNRVLLVSEYANDPLATVLTQQGFFVRLVNNPKSLTPADLTGTRCVIINNVPAPEFRRDFLEGLDFFVKIQGGGFCMAGGKRSFGAGGYFESSIDPLLPVSMELRQDHRRLAVAMAIVMDRSGSMSVGVTSGGKMLTKMDLANDGAARSTMLLGDHDLLTIYAVDTEAHEVAPLTTVGPNREEICRRVRSVVSMGGGIYICEALTAGWNAIKKAPVGQRHIILFADASDSRQALGDYASIVAEIIKGGGTVSVIGMGTDHDCDADILKDVAQLGGGRIFFSDRVDELPAIFAQETVAVARSVFVDKPAATKSQASWQEISPRPMNWMPSIDGYNLSYLRPEASQALLTGDESAAPLVAYWNRGLGRSAAITFPLGGEFSDATRNWPQYGDFLQTLSRWLAGPDLPKGLSLRTQLDGTRLVIDFYFADEWVTEFAQTPPRLSLIHQGEKEPREEKWSRLRPGHYQAMVALDPGVLVRGAVIVGKSALPFGPVMTGINAEWQTDRQRLRDLRQVITTSGGRELTDLSSAWKVKLDANISDMRGSIFTVILLLLLVEALCTRMGWSLIPKKWFWNPARAEKI